MIAPMPMTPPPDEARVPLVALLHEMALYAPMAALEHTAWLHAMTHDVRALAITQARRNGQSWRAIAAALDQAPSTIQRRFSCLDPS